MRRPRCARPGGRPLHQVLLGPQPERLPHRLVVALGAVHDDGDVAGTGTRMHGAEVYDRSIDVQILRLRRKIELDASDPKFIRTERGVGYVFDASVDVIH